MKRILCILIGLCCVLCGCSRGIEKPKAPVSFYYLRSDISYDTKDSVIDMELRESFGHEEDYVYLLNLYLLGPTSENLTKMFPEGSTVVEVIREENAVTVTLCDTFAQLSGINLTTACVCLTKTVCAMTGCSQVTIQAETLLLDSCKSITMTKDSGLLQDSYTSPAEAQIS